MARSQAKAGGQTGINGEWYEGGQFLPGSEDTIKGAIKIKAGTKAQIAPYMWGTAPEPNMLSIYDRLQHYCTDNRKECKYEKGKGFVGLKLTPSKVLVSMSSEGPQGWDDEYQRRYEWATALAEKFNSGERWFPLADDPYHYLNGGHVPSHKKG